MPFWIAAYFGCGRTEKSCRVPLRRLQAVVDALAGNQGRVYGDRPKPGDVVFNDPRTARWPPTRGRLLAAQCEVVDADHMVALTHQVFAVVFSGDGNRRANGNIVRMSQDYHGGFSWLDN